MKTLSFIILLFPYYVLLSLSPPDSCLKTYDRPEDETFENPYNVRIDSCESSPTYGDFYSDTLFTVVMEYNIIPRAGLFPEDTLIEYNISDIDTNYTDAINEFLALQTEYGNFRFQEQAPHIVDTNSLLPRRFFINFDNNVNIENIQQSLGNLKSVNTASFKGWFRVLSTVKETQDFSFLNYNTQTEILNIQNKLGIESKLVIYNIHGNEVLAQNISTSEASISLTSLSRGVYFIYFNESVIKLIK